MTRKLLNLAVLALLAAGLLAVGSTGADIRDSATAASALVPGQSYTITIPAGDFPRCRDVSDDGLRTPLSDWRACPAEAQQPWFPQDSFTATYLREYQGGHLFDTPWGERSMADRWIN